MLSPAGVFSGTSGKQKTTQEWISAKLNCPTRLSLFMGLEERQRDRKKLRDKESESEFPHLFETNLQEAVESSPVLVYAVCALMEGQRFDLVLADLAGLGLQSGGDVGLQGAILSLNGPHL